MLNITVERAKDSLGELISAAINGEEIIIEKDEQAVKLVPFSIEKPKPKFGSAKGKIEFAENFDEPIDDFAEYMK